jgi:GDP-L-fucose synthase
MENSFWKDKKVLITGAGGFIGSYVVESLVEKGSQVYAGLRNEKSLKYFLEPVVNSIEIVYGDLNNFEECENLVKNKDVVLNLAAKVGGVDFNRTRSGFLFRENLRPFLNLLEASRRNHVGRFLTVSSACVYPANASVPTPEEEGFKDLPEKTNEGYGMAKRMQELQSLYYHKDYGMEIAIARPYNAYGPRDDFDLKTSHVIPALIKRVFDGENPFRVWGSGQQTRSFLYAKDFAEGLLEVAEKHPYADPINIGNNRETSIEELVRLIFEISGKNPKIEFDTSKPEGQKRRTCDTSKCEKILGWKAKASLREGLEKTIDWYKKEFLN